MATGSLLLGIAIACLLLVSEQALAQDVQDRTQRRETESVVIYGRAPDLIGEAHLASEGVVGYADYA